MSEITPDDAYMHRMKTARDSSAVLKLRLLSLKSQLPGTLIFVFEGDDDKIVYFHWIKRLRAELSYEAFPCRGKKYVLKLREAVSRDLGNARDGVYFFVDRDFDDLAGHPTDENTFLTDCYSTENYLVSDVVLEDTLINEFHCHGRPDVRGEITEIFRRVYGEFLFSTKEINRRWYIACQTGVSIKKKPEKIKSIANVAFDCVLPHESSAEEIIVFGQEPDADAAIAHYNEFDGLDPVTRYRGKFALMFFDKWISLLADEYANPESETFGDLDRSAKARLSELSLGSYAAKSEFPQGLREFLHSINVTC